MPDPTLIDWKAEIRNALSRENDSSSHRELDPDTYHPSQIAKCKRQCAISKLGLEHHDAETLGNFKAGTLFHEWAEEEIQPGLDGVLFEVPVEHYEEPAPTICWKGHTDVYDTRGGVLYDFKTRGDYFKRNGRKDFQYLDPPVERHRNQLLVYMRSLEVEYGQIVYVDKKNPAHVTVWPEDEPMSFDWDAYNDLLRKAREMQGWFRDNELPESKAEVPFDKCDCFICELEEDHA